MNAQDPILSDFLTATELAAQLGVSARTLDRWEALDEGPPRTRIGRRVLYRRESVRAWLAAREQQSAA
jgi:excisionase family DNA binding protein